MNKVRDNGENGREKYIGFYGECYVQSVHVIIEKWFSHLLFLIEKKRDGIASFSKLD